MPTRTLGLCVYQPIGEQATIAMTQRTHHLPHRKHLGSVGAPGTVLLLVIMSRSSHFYHAHPTEEDTDFGANNHGNSLNLGCVGGHCRARQIIMSFFRVLTISIRDETQWGVAVTQDPITWVQICDP